MLAILQPGIAMQPYEPVQNFVHVAHVAGQPQSSSAPNSSGVDVAQIRAAYGFGSLSENGSGQTIAIVDAYDDPTIATDLHNFDVQYNLPDPPSFSKYDEHGGTNYPPTAPSGTNWELEEALDVEWAHAIAPDAAIDLFEADDLGIDNLTTAVSTAAATSGVSVVSMSWGSPEFTGESTYDSTFAGSTQHPVAFLAAAGDAGAPGIYPGFSPNVIAVGGTTLGTDSAGDYLGETTWNDQKGATGGGPSTQEAKPSFQSVVSTGYNARTIPDVASAADEIVGASLTGVWVDDSYDYQSAPWVTVTGTSFATPVWAATISMVDQERASLGLADINGPAQGLAKLYQLPSTDYVDITTGNNNTGNGGYSAGPGYDLTTGRGTPKVANNLVTDLADNVVTVDRSTDPSGDIFNVSTNGTTTTVTVNGTTVYTGLGAAIDQLNITGSSDDTLTLDYSGGSLVPYGTISFNGGSGSNSLTVTSPSNVNVGANSISLSNGRSGSITLSDVGSMTLNVASGSNSVDVNGEMGTVAVDAGSGDSVTLYAPSGSTGNSFNAQPTSATLSGTGYTYSTSSGPEVTAVAASASDTASLASSSSLSGQFYGHAKGSSTTGPLAVFQGSGWNDVAKGFAQVTGTSHNSADVGYLDDQYSSGTAYSHATYSLFENSAAGYDNIASGFHEVTMTSYTSSDVAYLDDTYADAAGTVYAHATYSVFQGNDGSFDNVASGFHEVAMTSHNSADVANLDDEYASVGATAYSHPSYGLFEGNNGSFDNIATSFQRVNITSYNSGADVANLDDSGNNGHFYGYSTYAYMQGAGYYNYVSSFHLVQATSDYPTVDAADLYDYSGGASVNASGSTAIMTYANGYQINVTNYAAVDAHNGTTSWDTYTPAAKAAGYIYLLGNWSES